MARTPRSNTGPLHEFLSKLYLPQALWLSLLTSRYAHGIAIDSHSSPINPVVADHHITYIFTELNDSLTISGRGFPNSSKVVYISHDLDDGPVSEFFLMPAIASLSRIEPADFRTICASVATCVGRYYDTTTTHLIAAANLLGDRCRRIGVATPAYFTVNDYEKIKDYTVQSIISFSINLASTEFGNVYLNAEAGQDTPPVRGDSCGAKDQDRMARDYAGMIEAFCNIIKAKDARSAATHHISGEFVDTREHIAGVVNVAKMYVSRDQLEVAQLCAAVGIDWKRWLGIQFTGMFSGI